MKYMLKRVARKTRRIRRNTKERGRIRIRIVTATTKPSKKNPKSLRTKRRPRSNWNHHQVVHP